MKANSPQRILRDIGRRIAEVRGEHGQTQEQLAEKLDVSVRYIQSVEAGKENLSVETIAKLGNALRIPLIELFAPPLRRAVKRGRPASKSR